MVFVLSKYVWACLSFKSKPDVNCFFNHYELQYQPKAVKVNGERRLAQFGSCTFIPKVHAKGKENLRISYAQKPRWPNTWTCHWFYAAVPGLTVFRGGRDTVIYPLASKMSLLVAERRVQPKMTEGRKACEKAFELACRFSSGRDLVEEFLAADIWPLCLGSWKDCKFRKVPLPLYGTEEPVYFPVFGLTRPKGKSSKRIVAEVEAKAMEILGPMKKLEYLSRVAIGGNMPRLNRVFDELKVNYEHWVPPLELQVSSSKEAKAKAADPDIAKMGAKALEATEVNGAKAEALKRKKGSEYVAPHKKARFSKGESSQGKTIWGQTAPELGLTAGSGGEVMVVDEDLGGYGVDSLPTAMASACVGVAQGQVSVVASETVEDVEEAMSNLPRLFEDESEFSLLDVMAESKGEGNTQAPNFVAEGGCKTRAKVSSLSAGLDFGDVEQNLSMLDETETAECQDKGEETKAGAIGGVDDAKESSSHGRIPVSGGPSAPYAGPSRSDPPSPNVGAKEVGGGSDEEFDIPRLTQLQEEFVEEFAKLEVESAVNMALHSAYQHFRTMEVIRDKVCEGRALRERVRELRG